jgi:Ser/Thr protein kinase RdoA (MazF antagonist)
VPRGNGDEFYARPESEQIQGLEALATCALARWGLTDVKLSPAAYRENMTFRVDAGGRGPFALRIHQAGYRTDDQIRSELAFMEALRGRGVATPEVVPARDGALFVVSERPEVPEPRQCDLFEWIAGRALRATGDGAPLAPDALAEAYRQLGRQAAAIADAVEDWERPSGFTRPVWDAEGMFGPSAHLGDWRRLARLTREQRALFERLDERLRADLEGFGRGPDRFGLCHGDFLPENLMVSDGGLRLIDFDDCGESWQLFDFATAVFDLLGEPAFDPCLGALVAGYRERRPLPDEHLAQLPTFLLARALSYLGWSATRSHLVKAAAIAPHLLAALEGLAPAYLADRAS